MRVLVTGATGFIGSSVSHALLARGHQVVGAARGRWAETPPGMSWLSVDFSAPPDAQWWGEHLPGVDAVVNAVGILREKGTQTFDALHTRAPAALFEACARAGVGTVVQVSALGADASATTRYHLSKKAADDRFRELGLRGAIVQPSLVYGPGGASAGLFNTLSLMPLVLMPMRGEMQVQPVHVDDVVDGIVALVESPDGTRAVAFVGPEPLTMRAYLGKLRKALGVRSPLRMGPYPVPLFMAAASIAGLLPGSPLDRETAAMLLRGNAAPAEDFRWVLGRAPIAPEAFIPPEEANSLRRDTLVAIALPVLRWSIALLWIWTAVVSAWLYPKAESLRLLGRVGLHGAAADAALYAGAALDMLLGVLVLFTPPGRRGWVWLLQLLLIGGYTGVITLFLPEYWLHPYGPISKNLPIMAAIGLAWALESGHKRR